MTNVVVWLAVAVIAIIAEAVTNGLIAVWFAPAALVSALLAWLKVPFVLQVIVFFAVSGLLAALLYQKLHDSIASHSAKTNLDAITGASVTVEEPVDAMTHFGRVTYKGVSWKAHCETAANKGETLIVENIDGVVLYCKKA